MRGWVFVATVFVVDCRLLAYHLRFMIRDGWMDIDSCIAIVVLSYDKVDYCVCVLARNESG